MSSNRGNGVPSIAAISVTSGTIGDTVDIYGSNFSTTASNNTVDFNGIAALVVSATDNTIVVVVPAGTSTGNVTVSVNGQASSNPQAFTVLSANVYFTGYGKGGSSYQTGIYFRNGAVAGYVAGSSGPAVLTGIYASGKDIYVCGDLASSNNISTAAYWKNGVEVDLSDGTKNAGAQAIWISGSDIYVAGGDGTGIQYWKNGNLVNIPVSGTFNGGTANKIFATGSDVYLSGTYNDAGNNQVSAYWKNAVQVNLPGSTSYTYSIFVSGNDVYVAGNTYNSLTKDRTAVVWKNGVETDLTDGTVDAVATGVYVSGADVYVSGYQTHNNNASPFYWKNGSKVELTPGPGQTFGLSGNGNDIYIGCNGIYLPNGGIELGFWYNSTFEKFSIPSTFSLSEILGIFVQAP